MAKEKKIQIYLLINSEEGVEPKRELVEEKIKTSLNEGQQEDLFIKIKKDENGYIDEIINFAEEKKYRVINCGKTYILNKCFQGTKYALFGKNIAHEAINKFQADGENRYFFLCDNGKKQVAEIHGKKYIYSGAKYFEAKNAELISFSKYETGQKSNYAVIQKVNGLSLIFNDEDNQQKITYNNKKLSDIFERNLSPQGKGIENKAVSNESKFPCVTFKGKNVKKPEEIGKELFCYDDFFIGKITETEKGKEIRAPEKGYEQLAKASMRQYVFEGTALYEKIKDHLEKINSWEEDKPWNETYREEDSVLSVIGKSDKETYFSSLVAYMFQNAPEILKKFLGDIEIENYLVYREENNVDILIRGDKNIVIIENKIDAGINEAQCKEWSDLIKDDNNDKDKEGDEIKKKINEERAKQEGQGKDTSQLDKYYSLALYYARKGRLPDESIRAYILCPEYKVSYYIDKKGSYINGDNYEVKSYKELKDYIEDRSLFSSLKEDKRRIIEDLGSAISPYAIKQNTYYMDQVCSRFFEEINKQ